MSDLRTSVLAITLWAVALALVFIPVLAMSVGIGLVIAAIVIVALRRRGGHGLVVLALLCGAAVCATVADAQPQRDLLGANDGHVVEALAEVTSSASIGADGRLWFDAQTIEIGPPDRLQPISAPVRIGIEPMAGADLGARVRVTGQARRTDAGERAALVVFGARAEVANPASGIFAVAAATRADFITRATRLPEPGAGLLPGLAVGDTRAVSPELSAAMLASGLSHLTAVSGKIPALLENRSDLPCK